MVAISALISAILAGLEGVGQTTSTKKTTSTTAKTTSTSLKSTSTSSTSTAKITSSSSTSKTTTSRTRHTPAGATYTNTAAAASALSAAGISETVTAIASSLLTTTDTAVPTETVSYTATASGPYGGTNKAAYSGPGWIPVGSKQGSKPALSQQQTNGNSTWGLLNATTFPDYLPGPLTGGYPWGSRTVGNTNPYDYADLPDTGVTRTYSLSIATQTIAPDGVTRSGITINQQFPGPAIEANWGDWITVTVTNDLVTEGTSIHWHGLLQSYTPYMDGIPGVTQCPIAPGDSFTYTFRADLVGTSFYHSHYSAQYNAGVEGPMIIYGPTNAVYDVDIGPVLLTDWYHPTYQTLLDELMATAANGGGIPPLSNSNLINGKMNYPCADTTLDCTPAAGLSQFSFESGKTYRLRLINGGSEGMQKFSIDGHNLTVFANDFVEIEPYVTDVVTLGVGQRSDILVTATGTAGEAYWMRSNMTTACTFNDGINPNAVAIVLYEDAANTTVPTTSSSVSDTALNTCNNDPLSSTVPVYAITPDANPPLVTELQMETVVNSTGYLIWDVNNVTFRGDYNDPVLLEAVLGKTDFTAEWQVYNTGNATSYRLVMYNYFTFASHPMHLHGHDFFVLDQGFGTWDGTVTNPANPQRRDTQIIEAANSATDPAYLVVDIPANNPGAWLMHCHIAWHVSDGLTITILENPAGITETGVPMVMAETCRNWWNWTDVHVVDMIDSGL